MTPPLPPPRTARALASSASSKAEGGPRIWFHVPRESALDVVEMLTDRLLAARADLRVLVSAATTPLPSTDPRVDYARAPAPKRAEAQAFLRNWAPDLAVCFPGEDETPLRAELEAGARKMPVILLDVDEGSFPAHRAPWAKIKLRSRLKRFHALLTVSQAAANQLVALGAAPARVQVTGKLRPGPTALPYNEAERDELIASLATRPVWYGADVPAAEAAGVISAQAHAQRRAHRTLAILAPADEAAEEALLREAEAQGLRAARRSESFEIDEEVNVFIADDPGEEGLWYRLAPLTYLGGTLSGAASRTPFEAAALGSAIIHGPAVWRHGAAYGRLARAAATEPITDLTALGPAITRLNAPDRSAALAHAAWDVATEGAEMTDRVVTLLLDTLAEEA
ncbi:MAG: glycosyltransferase N-terminal domain-containing protein [Pseudomonadota bacterium]